ncbi:PilN domain-containing protein [Ideonella livida]|uniref:Fimbrial assembly protein n=1 Tax=Ideonella livida TaxID=2707176 RepID=A0A7C9PHT9_9BURK|nr:PilN domain-containing protein [Ideonella livida]NDY92353.1 fimbrial assembly protein [Ideonella livida]
MILINLLPHREARRKERKRMFLSGLGLAGLVGVAMTVFAFGIVQQMISSQEGRNARLQSEIGKLDQDISNIASLRNDIDALKARQKAVEDLQTNRNAPVLLLNELARQTPEGIYLTGLRQTGTLVALTGVAQSNDRVSEFLRNVGYNSEMLEKPELIDVKAGNVGTGKEARRALNFSIRVRIKPVEQQVAEGAKPGKPEAAKGVKAAASAPRGVSS